METKKSTASRTFQIAALGFVFVAVCILFTIAFNNFQPDQYSQSDRYFPSSTPTNTRTPTSTPTQTLTPTNTFTPTATVTSTPDYLLTAVSQGNIIFSDTFDTNENNWNGFHSGNIVSVEEGRLSLLSDERGYVGLSLCATCPETGNSFFIQSAVATEKEVPETYGLAFCASGYNTNYYTFVINQRTSRFSLYKNTSSGWIELSTNLRYDAIHKFPSTNVLGIFFDRGIIKLYINDSFVFAYEDKEPHSCRRAGYYVNNGNVKIYGDDLTVYGLVDTQ